MINIYPSENILWLWRIRLALVFLIPSSVNSWFFKTGSMTWILISLILALIFIIFFWIYYPIKFKKLSYTFNGKTITKNYGIIYTMVKNIPLDSIQFIIKRTSPLGRFFGICSFVLVGAGSKMYISGIKPDELNFIYEYLEGKNE